MLELLIITSLLAAPLALVFGPKFGWKATLIFAAITTSILVSLAYMMGFVIVSFEIVGLALMIFSPAVGIYRLACGFEGALRRRLRAPSEISGAYA